MNQEKLPMIRQWRDIIGNELGFCHQMEKEQYLFGIITFGFEIYPIIRRFNLLLMEKKIMDMLQTMLDGQKVQDLWFYGLLTLKKLQPFSMIVVALERCIWYLLNLVIQSCLSGNILSQVIALFFVLVV